MIDSKSFQSVGAVAAAIVASGKVAASKPGTPLGELTRLSSPIVQLDATGNIVNTTKENTDPSKVLDNSQFFAMMVEAATTGSLENPTQHSLQVDALVDDIASIVQTHISHTRNVVRPLVAELAQAIESVVFNEKTFDAADSTTIITLRVPAVLSDASFLDTIKPFEGKALLIPDTGLSLGPVSKEELDALMTTGHDRTDAMIVEWLSHLPESFALDIWSTFFCASTASALDMRGQSVNRLNPFERADVALTILLMARKLEGTPQSNGMTLAKYNTTCAQYVEYASCMLSQCLRTIAMHTSAGRLVIEKDSAKLIIKVNGNLYGQWLNNGGSTNVILGVLIDDNAGSTIGQIDEKRDVFERQWQSYKTIYATRMANGKFDRVRAHTLNRFIAMFAEAPADEKQIVGGKAEAMLEEARKTIEESLSADAFKDPFDVALRLIAGIRFGYTSAYQILSDIVQANKINPDVDVREAALIAAINYVSDYVAYQISAE